MAHSRHIRRHTDVILHSHIPEGAQTKLSKASKESRSSKIDHRPVSINISHSYIKLIMIQGSKLHVGDEVYIQIVDCTGMLRRGGPYLIAKVLGGGKFTLCYHNGDNAESGRDIDEKDLVAA